MTETSESHEAEQETSEEEQQKLGLAFPEAAVVRVMKKNLDKEKMIKKEVKIAMNKWLEEMCSQVTKSMNRFPYVMMTISEFRTGKRVYDSLEEFEKEKERILSHLDAIKKDIEKLERDLGKVEKDVIEMS
jgi:histone H3/H4